MRVCVRFCVRVLIETHCFRIRLLLVEGGEFDEAQLGPGDATALPRRRRHVAAAGPLAVAAVPAAGIGRLHAA